MYEDSVIKYIVKHGALELKAKGSKEIEVFSVNYNEERVVAPDPSAAYIDLATVPRDRVSLRFEPTGINVKYDCEFKEFFYPYPESIRLEIEATDLQPDVAYELRQLLYAAIELAKDNEQLKVFALKNRSFFQSSRGHVIITCAQGDWDNSRVVRGYYYSQFDHTIKFDNLQSWRVRELGLDELVKFDPKWAEVIAE